MAVSIRGAVPANMAFATLYATRHKSFQAKQNKQLEDVYQCPSLYIDSLPKTKDSTNEA